MAEESKTTDFFHFISFLRVNNIIEGARALIITQRLSPPGN